MRTIQREIASAVLVSRDQKIFLGRHRDGGVYENCWLIPGGGVDEGETVEQALVREMREETGIDIAGCVMDIVSTHDGTAEKTLKATGERVIAEMHFNDFRVQLPHNAADIPPAPDDELTESRWFTVDEIAHLTLSPPTETLFRKLGYIT